MVLRQLLEGLCEEKLRQVFQAFDLDKDGYLDYNEVCSCARESVHQVAIAKALK